MYGVLLRFIGSRNVQNRWTRLSEPYQSQKQSGLAATGQTAHFSRDPCDFLSFKRGQNNWWHLSVYSSTLANAWLLRFIRSSKQLIFRGPGTTKQSCNIFLCSSLLLAHHLRLSWRFIASILYGPSMLLLCLVVA